MTDTFRVGSDGQRWWWQCRSARENLLQVCPAAEMHEADTSFCDPFSLTGRTPARAARELKLRYAGQANRGGSECRMVESWGIETIPGQAPWGTLRRWWVDLKNGRPLEAESSFPFGVARTRYLYGSINQPIPAAAFAVPEAPGGTPTPPDALDADYTRRFVIIRDGSDGVMSLRWGKQGPKGTSSSGLN